jgi:hypothetical protein
VHQATRDGDVNMRHTMGIIAAMPRVPRSEFTILSVMDLDGVSRTVRLGLRYVQLSAELYVQEQPAPRSGVENQGIR